ncbi:MAG: hypothetical protein ACOYLB_01065 [Phototrophicaceae bacterium]
MWIGKNTHAQYSVEASFTLPETTIEYQIGSPFTLMLEVTLPLNARVTQTPLVGEWEWLTLQSITPLEPLLLEGFKKERWELSVVSWQSGELSTPKATIVVQDEVGNYQEVSVVPTFFRVISVWDGGQSLKQPTSLVKMSLRAYWIVGIVSGILTILIGLGWQIAFQSKIKGIHPSFRLPSTPDRELLRQLKNISVTALTIEEQANLIDKAIRHYIQRQFKPSGNLSHLTYEEFQQFLEDDLKLIGGTELHDLYAILTTIKYSPDGFTVTDASTLPDLARTWFKSILSTTHVGDRK